MVINNFRGDLTDISARKTTVGEVYLYSSVLVTAETSDSLPQKIDYYFFVQKVALIGSMHPKKTVI